MSEKEILKIYSLHFGIILEEAQFFLDLDRLIREQYDNIDSDFNILEFYEETDEDSIMNDVGDMEYPRFLIEDKHIIGLAISYQFIIN
ncbi:MAG: hypothetical protein ACFFDH_08210 [Promethearchaeota archaeon]